MINLKCAKKKSYLNEKKIRNKNILQNFIFLIFLTLLSIANTNAITIGNNTIHSDGEYNYTATQNFSITNITYSPSNLQINGEDYCLFENRTYLSTKKNCIDNSTVLNSELEITSTTNYYGNSSDISSLLQGYNFTIKTHLMENQHLDSVWLTIWNNSIGTSTQIANHQLSNSSPNNWEIKLNINSSYITKIYNYTIYANNSDNKIINLSGTFKVGSAGTPIYSNFNLTYGTTDFALQPNLFQVANATLATEYGKIQFDNLYNLNVVDEDYDQNVIIKQTFISVNTSGLHETFNTTTTLEFSNADCTNPLVYYIDDFRNTNNTDIITTGNQCNATTSPSCTNIVCDSGSNKLSFDAEHFSSYGSNSFANLTIFDINDTNPILEDSAEPHEQIKFFANYEDISNQPIENALCQIRFNNTAEIKNLSFNTSTNHYEYERNFTTLADFNWNVTCSKLGYGTLTVNDTIQIRDVTKPEIDAVCTPDAIPINGTTLCSATVTDNYDIDKVNVTLYLSNSSIIYLTEDNFTITETNNKNITYEFNYTDKGDYGIYNVSWFARDNSSEIENNRLVTNFNTSFEVSQPAIQFLNCTPQNSGKYDYNINLTCLARIVSGEAPSTVDTVTLNITLPNSTILFPSITRFEGDGLDGNYTFDLNNTILLGNYTFTFWTNDTNDISSEKLVNITISDNLNPKNFNLIPFSNVTQNETYNINDTIEISLNVSDNYNIEDVNITLKLPNGTITKLQLTNISEITDPTLNTNKFNISYTIPQLLGQYNITFISTDGEGNINSTETTFFNVHDITIPKVFDTEPIENSIYEPFNIINISTNISDNHKIINVSINLSLPNGTTQILQLTNISEITDITSNTNRFSVNYQIPRLLGTYNITFMANDGQGNINNSEITNFTVTDTTIPNGFDLLPIENAQYNVSQTIEFSINASDNYFINTTALFANITLPNGTIIQLQLNNISEITNHSSNSNKFNNSYTIPKLLGQYNVTFIVTDENNNINITETTFFIGGDTILPEVFNINPISNTEFNVSETIELSANISDNYAIQELIVNITLPNGTITQIQLSNISEIGNPELISNKFNSSYTIPKLLGTYNLTFIGTDGNNNTNQTETINFIAVDNQNPQNFNLIPFSNASHNEVFNVLDTIEIGMNVSDNYQLNLSEIKINLTLPNGTILEMNLNNISEIINPELTTNKFNTSYTIPQLLGQYNITFISTDGAGNTNITETSFYIVSDPIVPNVFDISPEINSAYNSSEIITISANASDNYNISNFEINLTLPNGTTQTLQLTNISEITDITSNTNRFSVNYQIPRLLGTYNIKFLADDGQFNINDSEITNFTVTDLITPKGFDLKPNGEIYEIDETIQISLNATDNYLLNTTKILANITLPNGTITQLQLNNISEIINHSSNSNKFNNSYTIPHLLGQYNITFIVTDENNNMNTTETTFFIGNDSQNPKILGQSPIGRSHNPLETIEISANISDNFKINLTSTYVNITLPNSSIIKLSLENTSEIIDFNSNSNKFNTSYSIPRLLGNYDLKYYTIDENQNVNITNPGSFTVNDTINPQVFDLNPNGNTYNMGQTIQISANITDNHYIDTATITITLPNSSTEQLTLTNISELQLDNTDKYQVDYLIPELSGTYTINFTVTDDSGNQNSSESTIFVGQDTNFPQINFENPTPSDNSIVTNNIIINISINESEIENTTINLNGTKFNCFGNLSCDNSNISLTNLGNNIYQLLLTQNNLAEGEYSINATIYDKSANSNSTETTTFTVDTSNPIVTLITPQNDTKQNSNSLTFTCNATNTELKNITLHIWNSTDSYYTNTTNISGSQNQTSWSLTNIPDENYKWNCQAYDTMELSAWNSENRTFIIDTRKPLVNITSPTNNQQISDSTPEIVFDIYDNLAQTINYTIKLNSSSNNYIYTGSSSSGSQVTFQVPDNLEIGNYTFYINTTDNVLNKNTSETFNFEIVPPVIYLLKPEFNKSLKTHDITFEFNISDPVYSTTSCELYIDNTLEYTNNSVTTDIITSFTKTGLSAGAHNWNVTCNNGAKIVSNVDTFKIDVTNPEVTLISPSNNVQTNQINQTFTCNATNTALTNMTLFVWNSTDGIYYNNTKPASGTFTENSWNLTNMPHDDYKWNCKAMDVAENIGWATNNFSLPVRNLTDEIILSNVKCSINSKVTWQDCNTLNYKDTITHIKTTASLDIGTITDVKFNLYNSDDNQNYIEDKSYTEIANVNEYIYASNYQIVDSGDWKLSITATEQDNSVVTKNVTWNYDYGYANITLINPNTNTQVQQNQFFNFEAQINCYGGECDEIEVILDPEETETNNSINESNKTTKVVENFENITTSNEIITENISFVENNNISDIINETNTTIASNLTNLTNNTQTNETITNITETKEKETNENNNTIEIGKIITDEISENEITELNKLEIEIQTNYGGGNYEINESSYIIIWDQNDIGMPNAQINSNSLKIQGDTVTYYADYRNTKTGESLSTGSCSIDLEGSSNPMSYVSGYFTYSKTMNNIGEFDYSINCTATNYTTLTITDSIIIESSNTNSKGGAISTVVGTLPFYTTDNNPQTCTLKGNENCTLDWDVNATGSLNKAYTFFVEVNGTKIEYNKSKEINITITNTDTTNPEFVSIFRTPTAVINGSDITINAVAQDNIQVDSIWGIITRPDNTNISITSFPYTYTTPTNNNGVYNITYFVNDTSNNTVSTTSFFEVAEPIEYTFEFEFAIVNNISSNTNLSLELIHTVTGDAIYTTITNESNHTITLPNVLYDIFVFGGFNNTIETTLKAINLTENTGKQIGLDRHNEFNNYLVTYGIETGYNFSVAEVVLSYDSLSYSSKSYLQVWKCDDYNFTSRECYSTEYRLTNDIINNQNDNQFELSTNSFSAFSIKEVIPTPSSSGSSGGGGGGSWVKEDKIKNITECEEDFIYDELKKRCVLDVDPIISEEIITPTTPEIKPTIPKQLFDIEFNIDERTITSIKDLSGTVTFTSFGSERTPVDYEFILTDAENKIIQTILGKITVQTQKSMLTTFEEFNKLNLKDGDYKITFKSLYNENVEDKFEINFKIKSKSEEKSNLWKIIIIGIIFGGIVYGLNKYKFEIKNIFNTKFNEIKIKVKTNKKPEFEFEKSDFDEIYKKSNSIDNKISEDVLIKRAKELERKKKEIEDDIKRRKIKEKILKK